MVRFYDPFTLRKRKAGGSGEFEAKSTEHKGRLYTMDSRRISVEGVVSLSETYRLMAPLSCPLAIDDQVTVSGIVYYVGETPEVLTVKGKPHHKRVQLNRNA